MKQKLFNLFITVFMFLATPLTMAFSIGAVAFPATICLVWGFEYIQDQQVLLSNHADVMIGGVTLAMIIFGFGYGLLISINAVFEQRKNAKHILKKS